MQMVCTSWHPHCNMDTDGVHLMAPSLQYGYNESKSCPTCYSILYVLVQVSLSSPVYVEFGTF